ncbi:hypothetical protein TNCV_2874581 [Trichonephila clavipes]|nr:hypothetical protein TNCV_2874581 [Trichonephila clavipes]
MLRSDAQPPLFRSQENLVLLYRPTKGTKVETTLHKTGFEPRFSGVEARYATTQPLDFSQLTHRLKFSVFRRIQQEITFGL